MKKVLILYDWDINDYFAKEQRKVNGVTSERIFREPRNIMTFILKKICLKIKPLRCIFYGGWKKRLSNYDTIIINDCVAVDMLIEYIRKYTNVKIVIWFWNPVGKYDLKKIAGKYKVDFYTFDKKDSDKFDIHYKNQYYFSTIVLPASNIDNDIFFVGLDKGRQEIIYRLSEIFKNKGLYCNFNVVKTSRFLNFLNNIQPYLFFIKKDILKIMSYDKVLFNISKAKAILDIVQDEQSGITLRPLEALFFEKKLITNNLNIIKYDFYNENNIFIIGVNDFDEIIEFFNRPYCKISETIKEKYDFKMWIKDV